MNFKLDGVFSEKYFEACQSAISSHLQAPEVNFAITKASFNAICYMNGTYVSYNTSMNYLNFGSSVYNSSNGYIYRSIFGRLVNPSKQASEVEIATLMNPQGPDATKFVDQSRIILKQLDHKFSYSFYLISSAAQLLDEERALNNYFPWVICATVGVLFVYIGYVFRSFFVPLRLIISVFLSAVWVYGLAVIIFQEHGFLIHLFPSLKFSSGIYWLIPIMTFSIMVGLALDYDVFLFSRIVEYRNKGFSDKDAVVKAVEKTGSIITAAGLIMAVSFGGLLASRAFILNQYGLVLCFAVLFDTFIMRTLLVPAFVSTLGDWNWWPSKPVEVTKYLATEFTKFELEKEDME